MSKFFNRLLGSLFFDTRDFISSLIFKMEIFRKAGFHFVGFRIPSSGFRIPRRWIPDSKAKTFLDSGIRIALQWTTLISLRLWPPKSRCSLKISQTKITAIIARSLRNFYKGKKRTHHAQCMFIYYYSNLCNGTIFAHI